MKIDKRTGSVHLVGIEISPNSTLREFESSDAFATAKMVVNNEGWITYLLRRREERNEFALFFVFHNESLTEIRFSIVDPGLSWSNWSEEKDREGKEQIDAILRDCLGPPPYAFDWGVAISAIDTRGGGSQGILRYR